MWPQTYSQNPWDLGTRICKASQVTLRPTKSYHTCLLTVHSTNRLIATSGPLHRLFPKSRKLCFPLLLAISLCSKVIILQNSYCTALPIKLLGDLYPLQCLLAQESLTRSVPWTLFKILFQCVGLRP